MLYIHSHVQIPKCAIVHCDCDCICRKNFLNINAEKLRLFGPVLVMVRLINFVRSFVWLFALHSTIALHLAVPVIRTWQFSSHTHTHTYIRTGWKSQNYFLTLTWNHNSFALFARPKCTKQSTEPLWKSWMATHICVCLYISSLITNLCRNLIKYSQMRDCFAICTCQLPTKRSTSSSL